MQYVSELGGVPFINLADRIFTARELLNGDDRVIVFVQFRGLKGKVAKALEDYGRSRVRCTRKSRLSTFFKRKSPTKMNA
jgi:hypothetical protein